MKGSTLCAAVCVALTITTQSTAHTAHDAVGHPGAAAGKAQFTTRAVRYSTPPVELLNQAGEAVRLDRLLEGERPVLLQFIFTTCSTICPVMGATFAQVQADVLAVHPGTVMVSITIDPEYDTPERLRAFAKRNGAGEQWMLLTGDKADIHRTMRAFDALYAGDNKMYHQFNTYLRAGGARHWLRIDGMPGASELKALYRTVVATP